MRQLTAGNLSSDYASVGVSYELKYTLGALHVTEGYESTVLHEGIAEEDTDEILPVLLTLPDHGSRPAQVI